MTAPNPEGDVVLVPREPTEAMISALDAGLHDHWPDARQMALGAWKAMIEAAPAALQPSPAAPDGVREKVAAIIDPEAFMTLRQVCARAGKDWDARPSVVHAEYDPDGPIPNREEARQKALAKADAILAALPPVSGGGLGEPDDTTEDQIRSRAKVLIQKNGWKPGARIHLHGVVELMTSLGMDLTRKPADDRCAYPSCGCDFDEVCNTGLARQQAAPGREDT